MRRLRNAFLLGVLVGLVVALVRAVGDRRRPPDAVGAGSRALSRRSAGPTRTGDEGPVPSVLAPSTAPPTIGPAPSTAAPEVALPPVEVDPLPTTPPPEPAGGAPATPGGPIPDGATWVAPVEGACPEGYPVKAKGTSRIFHVPGGMSYDRTRPERCYPSSAAAEADGFRAAKR